MNEDTTMPSALMPADVAAKPKRPSNSRPILKIVLVGLLFVLLFVLFKR